MLTAKNATIGPNDASTASITDIAATSSRIIAPIVSREPTSALNTYSDGNVISSVSRKSIGTFTTAAPICLNPSWRVPTTTTGGAGAVPNLVRYSSRPSSREASAGCDVAGVTFVAAELDAPGFQCVMTDDTPIHAPLIMPNSTINPSNPPTGMSNVPCWSNGKRVASPRRIRSSARNECFMETPEEMLYDAK